MTCVLLVFLRLRLLGPDFQCVRNLLTLAPPLLGQAFIVREAEAMIGEPDPDRVMMWFTNRRTKYKKHHGVLPVRDHRSLHCSWV